MKMVVLWHSMQYKKLGKIFFGKTNKKNKRFFTFKDIRPHIFLLNFKFLTENYILDILMIYSKVLLSAKIIICDGHLK